MSWIGTTDSGAPITTWADIEALAPRAIGAFTDVQQEVWRHGDPVLLELARLRIAMLLGAARALEARSDLATAAGLTETKIAALASWPVSPLFDARERACLALAEQFMVDVNAIDETVTGPALEHLSPTDCYGFVVALWAFEQQMRVAMVLGLEMPVEASGLVTATIGDVEEPEAGLTRGVPPTRRTETGGNR